MQLSQFLSLGLLLCLNGNPLSGLQPSSLVPATTVKPTLTSQTPAAQRQVIMTLERTACFGFCPIYKLTIYGDGKVVYEGDRFVKVKGKQTKTISQKAVRQLISEFNRVNYFKLADQYTGEHTDAPSVITSFTQGRRSKTVNHYVGSRNVPQKLIDLENKIDAIVSTKQWIGTDEERNPASGQR